MTKLAPKEDTRTALIETGIDIMLRKGYNNTGLSEVLSACQVPKGSFYYYFPSKESFGLEIINTFDEKYVAQLDIDFSDDTLSPLQRLLKYVDDTIARAGQCQCSRGCLIANLSQEMADQNEVFRRRLSEIVLKRRDTIARVIQEAIDRGEISSGVDPAVAAEFFLCAWEGAIMRGKVQKSLEPYLAFKNMVFGRLFTASNGQT